MTTQSGYGPLSGPDRGHDAIDLVAATVDTFGGIVENAIFSEAHRQAIGSEMLLAVEGAVRAANGRLLLIETRRPTVDCVNAPFNTGIR